MKDWVISKETSPAVISITAEKVVLDNGLVHREIETDGCKTVSFRNLQKDMELISRASGDFQITVNKKSFGTKFFSFCGAKEVACEERVPFKRTSTMTYDGTYPPPGKAAEL